MVKKYDFGQSTVLVIGGSTGIGRGIADSLAQNGARVMILSRRQPNHFSDSLSRPLLWQPLDLSKRKIARQQLNQALKALNYKVDAVFYSAIYYGKKRTPFVQVKESEWLEQLMVNLHGLWLSLSMTLPLLKKRPPGLFVHISSEVVYNGGPQRSGYAATKSGASNLIVSVAQEESGKEVCLTQLLPKKMVDTAGIRRRRPTHFDYSDYMTPDHFSSAALHLLKSRGKGMHGKSYMVDENSKLCLVDQVLPPTQSGGRR